MRILLLPKDEQVVREPLHIAVAGEGRCQSYARHTMDTAIPLVAQLKFSRNWRREADRPYGGLNVMLPSRRLGVERNSAEKQGL